MIHVLRQACGALEEAHGAGLLHRDIKPGNIFLCPRRGPADVVKLLDFGLVKDLRGSDPAGTNTRPDILLGTPLYMSPESIADPRSVDARSDLYALGAVAYYLLSGKTVFAGRGIVEVCAQHLYAPPPPLSDPRGRSLPPDLQAVVMRCLEKNAADRYPDARALRAALDACSDAHAWTEAAAERWWALHGALLESSRPLTVDTSPPTLAVNLHDGRDAFRRSNPQLSFAPSRAQAAPVRASAAGHGTRTKCPSMIAVGITAPLHHGSR